MGLASKSEHYVPECPLVHVHGPSHDYTPGVYAKLISLLKVVVQKCVQKIMGCGYCMDVSCKMKIDILHGHNLGISSSGGSSFDSKTGSKGRFTKGYGCLFA